MLKARQDEVQAVGLAFGTGGIDIFCRCYRDLLAEPEGAFAVTPS